MTELVCQRGRYWLPMHRVQVVFQIWQCLHVAKYHLHISYARWRKETPMTLNRLAAIAFRGYIGDVGEARLQDGRLLKSE